MADNSPQNGTDTIATDDLATLNGGAVSGVKVQRAKVGYGSDGDLRDVDATHGLPVTDSLQQAGTWGYRAGASGTPSIPSGARIISVQCLAGGADATVVINGGNTITVPAGTPWDDSDLHGMVTGSPPTVVFTNTQSYYVSYVA